MRFDASLIPSWMLSLLWSAAFVLVIAPGDVRALTRDMSIQQLQHTVWLAADGAPGDVYSITQTTDGWLWLATPSGLYRFDGVRFEQFDLGMAASNRSEGVAVLAADAAGNLWVALLGGGVLRVEVGSRQVVQAGAGIPPEENIVEMTIDGTGRAWALSDSHLMYYQEGAWHRTGEEWNLPQAPIEAIVADSSGVLWAFNDTTLLALGCGARAFDVIERARGGDKFDDVLPSRDGTTWLYSPRGRRPVTLPYTIKRCGANAGFIAKSNSAIVDRDGNFWSVGGPFGKRGAVIREQFGTDAAMDRASTALAAESFTTSDGLSGGPMIFFEDREGSIWSGSKAGIDRFRNNSLYRIDFPMHPVYFAMAANMDGSLTVGTDAHGGIDGIWQVDRTAALSPLPPAATTCAFRDHAGMLWLGGVGRLHTLVDGALAEVAVPAGVEDARVQAIGEETDGTLWVAFAGHGLYEWRRRQWIARFGTDGWPASSPTVITSAAGALWIGYRDGTILRKAATAITRYTTGDGLRVGPVSAVSVGATVLAAGSNGVAMLVDGQFISSATDTTADALRGITGILQLSDGSVWMNGARGIVRTTTDELRQALVGRSALRYRLLNAADGLPGTAQQVRPLPTALGGADGRLWFAASNGLVWIDPARMSSNPLAPPIEIQDVQADGNSHPGSNAVVLPPLSREIRIKYTALALADPQRVQFRYRLIGQDPTWREAGNRREAVYGNLAPGEYRFEVTAANSDGVWNALGTSIGMRIEPAYYQTLWFRLLVALAAAIVAWAVYATRTRQIYRQLQLRLLERLNERERIARELHDTLLQGVQGIVWQFDAEVRRLPEGGWRPQGLEEVLERGRQMIVEARRRVMDLHRDPASELPLDYHLREVGDAAAKRGLTRFSLTVEGEPRALDAVVHSEALSIGREAITNAFRHADASLVFVRVCYGEHELRVVVGDDGKGLPSDAALSVLAGNHLGIVGMKKRAAVIKGRISIRRSGLSGTEVDLVVTASSAYLRLPRRRRRPQPPRKD